MTSLLLQLRKEVGGVEYTPTILILFYDVDDTIGRAKFEGLEEIMGAMRMYATLAF